MRKPRGITIIEILVIVAIIGILVAIIPFVFNRTKLDVNRATTDIQNLVQQARFEAIKRNKVVVVGPSGSTFRYFVDLNNNYTLDTGEPSKTIALSDYGSISLTSAFNGSSNSFRWSPDGLPWLPSNTSFSQGTVTLTKGSIIKCVKVSLGGRVRNTEGAAC